MPPLFIFVFLLGEPLNWVVLLVVASTSSYQLPSPIILIPNKIPNIIPTSANNPKKVQQADPQNTLDLTISSILSATLFCETLSSRLNNL